ncbi:unnamed protein product, partial [Amoebophrya sp. A120]
RLADGHALPGDQGSLNIDEEEQAEQGEGNPQQQGGSGNLGSPSVASLPATTGRTSPSRYP